MNSNCEDLSYYVTFAKICEKADMFEQMSEAMTSRCKIITPLCKEERDLLFVSYKNLIGKTRTAYRILQDQKEKSMSNETKKSILDKLQSILTKKVEDICILIDELTEKYLIPLEKEEKIKALYIKVQADYRRYRCEVASDNVKNELIKQTEALYTTAKNLVEELSAADPIKLGLYLNFSVFYFEIAHNQELACKMCQESFNSAVKEIDSNQDSDYKDSIIIIQLLRDNLTLWTTNL